MPDFEDEVEIGLADDKTFYDVIVASNKAFNTFDYGMINNLRTIAKLAEVDTSLVSVEDVKKQYEEMEEHIEISECGVVNFKQTKGELLFGKREPEMMEWEKLKREMIVYDKIMNNLTDIDDIDDAIADTIDKLEDEAEEDRDGVRISKISYYLEKFGDMAREYRDNLNRIKKIIVIMEEDR